MRLKKREEKQKKELRMHRKKKKKGKEVNEKKSTCLRGCSVEGLKNGFREKKIQTNDL